MHRLIQWIFRRRRRKDAVATAEFRKRMIEIVTTVQRLSTENRDLEERNARLFEIINSGEPFKDTIADLEAEIEEKRQEIAELRDENKMAGALRQARYESSRDKDRLEEYRDMLCNLINAIPSIAGKGRCLTAVAPYLAATRFIRQDQQRFKDFLLPAYTMPDEKGIDRGVPSYNEF